MRRKQKRNIKQSLQFPHANRYKRQTIREKKNNKAHIEIFVPVRWHDVVVVVIYSFEIRDENRSFVQNVYSTCLVTFSLHFQSILPYPTYSLCVCVGHAKINKIYE